MKKTKTNKTLKYTFIGILVLLFVSVGMYFNALKPIGNTTEPFLLEVKEGATLNSVLNKLEDDGYIRSSFAAKVYVKLNSKNALKVGSFEISKSMSTQEIVDTLIKPSNFTVSIRLPESLFAKDLGVILEKELGFEAETFVTLWNSEDYVKELIDKYEVLTSDILKEKSKVRVLLEGYIYPDTYSFSKNMSAKQVTEFILSNTEAKYLSIKDQFSKSKLSVHDVFKLASIVLYEAGDSDNQVMVSGVFMNRLNDDMLLQSSVTVCYTLYNFSNWRDCELYKNQAIDSPYNTYVYKGLPVGPILNPTVQAIENTINYTKHDYYYFVADVYEGGDGTVYYSRTFKEHDKKVNELRNK